jgi:hypothetical protein
MHVSRACDRPPRAARNAKARALSAARTPARPRTGNLKVPDAAVASCLARAM